MDTGFVLWPSSVAMSVYFELQPLLVRDKVCLDLGCGKGYCGKSAKQLGARQVIFCDKKEVVDLLGEEDVVPWDWNYNFVTDVPKQWKGKVDVVIASDILYEEESLDDVFASIWSWLMVAGRTKQTYCLAVIPRRNVDWNLRLECDKWGIRMEELLIGNELVKAMLQRIENISQEMLGDEFCSFWFIKLCLM